MAPCGGNRGYSFPPLSRPYPHGIVSGFREVQIMQQDPSSVQNPLTASHAETAATPQRALDLREAVHTIGTWGDEDWISSAQAVERMTGLPIAENWAAVARLLADKDALVSAGAGSVLRQSGAEAAGAVEVLTELLANPEEDVRIKAALAIGYIGAEARASVPAIHSLLTGEHRLREEYVNALTFIGPEADAAVPALNDILKNRDVETNIREAVVQALTSIKAGDEATVSVLTGVLVEEGADLKLRFAASMALSANAGKDLDPAVRKSIFSTWSQFGEKFGTGAFYQTQGFFFRLSSGIKEQPYLDHDIPSLGSEDSDCEGR